MLEHYSDEELQRFEREARIRAWDAPKALSGDMENPTANSTGNAFERFGQEWVNLYREVRRRGLSASTDDPTFRPQQRD